MIKQRVLSIISSLLFLGVVTVNALANILPINNYNTGELSDMLPNLFVPAGLTFSIWGIIYLLLLLLTITNLVSSFRGGYNRALVNFNILLSINYIFNILWIIAWHYRLIPLSLAIMVGIFFTLFFMDKNSLETGSRWFQLAKHSSISIYFGWISVAIIANITALLVDFGWKGEPLTETFWTILVISVGALIAILKVLLHKNIPYILVFIWAYSGIIIKRLSQEPVNNGIVGVTIGAIILIAISAVISVIRSQRGKA